MHQHTIARQQLLAAPDQRPLRRNGPTVTTPQSATNHERSAWSRGSGNTAIPAVCPPPTGPEKSTQRAPCRSPPRRRCGRDRRCTTPPRADDHRIRDAHVEIGVPRRSEREVPIGRGKPRFDVDHVRAALRAMRKVRVSRAASRPSGAAHSTGPRQSSVCTMRNASPSGGPSQAGLDDPPGRAALESLVEIEIVGVVLDSLCRGSPACGNGRWSAAIQNEL